MIMKYMPPDAPAPSEQTRDLIMLGGQFIQYDEQVEIRRMQYQEEMKRERENDPVLER